MDRPIGRFDRDVPQHVCPDLTLSQAHSFRVLAGCLNWDLDVCALDDLACKYIAVVHAGSAFKLRVTKQDQSPAHLRQSQGVTIYGSYEAMYAAFMQAIDDDRRQRGGLGAVWREFIDAGALRLANEILAITGWTLRVIRRGGKLINVIPTYINKDDINKKKG